MQKSLEQHWAVGSLGYPSRLERAPIARALPLSRTQARGLTLPGVAPGLTGSQWCTSACLPAALVS
jgi:hypothetical protein